MKYSTNKPLFKIIGLSLLCGSVATSNNVSATGVLNVVDHPITICHYPPSDVDNPVTMTINKSEWNAHRTNHGDATHRDTPGACGILAGEGCFAESLTFYGMNDDYDGIAVYQLDSSEVVGLTPAITFPDELESLTSSQGETYYALKSRSTVVGISDVSLYEITLKQTAGGTFTGDYWKVFDLPEGGFHSLDLIDGEFYIANNTDDKWVKFSLDGTILAERSFDDAMAVIPEIWRSKSIEDSAYDPVNKILYASHVWDAYQHGFSHLLAFDLSNGFENMVAVDKGRMYWEKVEGLLYKDGVLYAASDHDNKLFKIIQDSNGNIVGDGKGEDVSGWNGAISSDIEGLANAYLSDCSTDEPPISLPPLSFGHQGRLNIREVNELKITNDVAGGVEIND